MKNTMCLALIMLAILPAAAQSATGQNCSAKDQPGSEFARDYAACVDGLLREVHASLRKISERMEAGELTPEQARQLKLAATRDMISRLDAMSAVYEGRLNATSSDTANKVCAGTGSAAGNSSGQSATRTQGIVSVEELKRETDATSAVPGAKGAAR
jgi:hypothetical protein